VVLWGGQSYLVPVVVQQKCCYLLLLLAGGDGLLLACLLLLVQLLGLSFFSWTCCWSLVLLLLGLVLSFNPSSWFCWRFSYVWVMLCKNLCCSWCCVQEQWCSCDGSVLVEWVLLPLAVPISSSCWLGWLLWCCQQLHSVRWLSCLWAAKLYVSLTWSDPPCVDVEWMCWWLGAHVLCTPEL
jgi:hypothetical protein